MVSNQNTQPYYAIEKMYLRCDEFRTEFAYFGEVQSLIPPCIHIMALTPTTTILFAPLHLGWVLAALMSKRSYTGAPLVTYKVAYKRLAEVEEMVKCVWQQYCWRMVISSTPQMDL